MTQPLESDGFQTVYPHLTEYRRNRAQITGGILDRMARDLAEDIVTHRLTEREAHCIAANLAGEAIYYAAKLEAEE